MIWLGCHYIDLIRYIFDDEIVSVFAELGKLSKNDIDVEDTCSLILKIQNMDKLQPLTLLISLP